MTSPPILSVRLGSIHRKRLDALATRDGISAAEMLRRLIDAERERRRTKPKEQTT